MSHEQSERTFTAAAWCAATATVNPNCRVLGRQSLSRIAERFRVSVVDVDYGRFGADWIADAFTVTPSGDGRYLVVRLNESAPLEATA